MQNQPGFRQNNTIKPEGTVTIDADPPSKSKGNDDRNEQYVDYEEVK